MTAVLLHKLYDFVERNDKMAFLTNIKREDTEISLTEDGTLKADDIVFRSFLGSDGTITRDTALQIPEVSANLDYIADAFSSVPVRLYRKSLSSDGHAVVEEVSDDPRVRLLNADTNDTLSPTELKKAVVYDYFLSKGAYIYINKKRNRSISLNFVKSENVAIIRNSDPIFKSYKILVNGSDYFSCDFIKILRNTRDGFTGSSILDQITSALRTAYNTLKYQLLLVEKGGNKKGFLESKKKLGKEEVRLLKEAWSSLYSSNTENVPVLNDGVTFHESSNTSVEMQINQTRKTLNDELDRVFHINYKQSRSEIINSAVMPLGTAFETSLNRDFLLESEKDTMYWAMDYSSLLKASMQERFNAYQVAKSAGFMTTNEVRRLEGLQEYEGLDTINVGLSSVMYDVEKKTYYTPNTDKTHGQDGQSDPSSDDKDTGSEEGGSD